MTYTQRRRLTGPRRAWLITAAAASAAVVSIAIGGSAVSASERGDVPQPGAGSLGDPLFPALGNGGYHVSHYDLSFRFDPTSKVYGATDVIDARATQALSRFDLDFAGNVVRQVTVNGRVASFSRAGEKLIVTPAQPLPDGGTFRTVVAYTGQPTPHAGPASGQVQGFFPTADGFFLASEPDAAHSVFPCNDYPTDKAAIDVHLTVPDGTTAVANGVLASTRRQGAVTTWNWQERAPIATYLVQIGIGHYTIVRHRGPDGMQLRDVVPPGEAAALRSPLAGTSAQLAWLEHRLGSYPFATYGLLAVDDNIAFLNETQTLTVAPAGWLIHGVPGYPAWLVTDYAMTHELTHQWFGDSVSPSRWSDLWLNEGPATYYGYLYAAARGDLSFPGIVKQWYADDLQQRPADGPPAAPKSVSDLFNGPSVDETGALALYALQLKVGTQSFDKIMRTWVTAHRGGSASTADFIRTASQISGRDLTGFLRGWLYGATTPPMPTPGTAS
jgi:aminopeptidase N